MLIVISSPYDLPEEHAMIQTLFENGLTLLHLRKPEKDKAEMEEFIKGIAPRYYRNVVIHSHYSLIGKYNLKGIHLPEKLRHDDSLKEVVKTARSRRLTVSSSVHSVKDLEGLTSFDYLFLSPLFDSVSKKDYKGNIDLGDLENYIASHKPLKVIGLGGITSENFHKVMKAGFHGGAILGTIWGKSKEEAVKEFLKMKSMLEEYYNR